MASKGAVKSKNKFQATLVTGDRLPCAFCRREIDDELTYGKMYAIGTIQVHYFCALLSCCLVQKGKDTEGLFGFLYSDILAELERSKKHKCSYCGTGGAGLGCCVAQCRKQFHLPCGREKNAVSLFYGNYKSYCLQHVPKQKIPCHIMEQAKIRKRKANHAMRAPASLSSLKELCDTNPPSGSDTESVCVICYEAVDGFPTVGTFWPPCCARDAWFHRTCLQRMALSAGMHYLKCPLCNDKEQFYDAVVSQGYYVPDRDAAWELEQNAFAEIYERAAACGAERCLCPQGRKHDADNGDWDIKLCILCGTSGCHVACLTKENPLKTIEGNTCTSDGENKEDSNDSVRPMRYVCDICTNCAPEDLDSLASRIEAIILAEQRNNQQRANRPIMPSRMSLRRTKARIAKGALPSTSQNEAVITDTETAEPCAETNDKTTVTSSRLELNLKTPRKPVVTQPPISITGHTHNEGNTLFSPVRFIEQKLSKKIESLGLAAEADKEILCKVKEKLKKPRPLCEKKRIVNSVLETIFDDIMKKASSSKSPKIEAQEEITDINAKKASAQNTPEKLPNGRSSEMLPHFEDKTDDVMVIDDSSNSTFQLPSEFVAERNSDDSLPLFETPKKLKTVDIQKETSLEISENDEVVNVNVVKMAEKDNKEFIEVFKTENSVSKLNPNIKEEIINNLNIESFKSYYLNEVDKDFKCDFNHKHKDERAPSPKLRTAIDFAYDAYKKNKTDDEKRRQLKRKIENKDGVSKKKLKKKQKLVLKYKNQPENIKLVCSKGNEDNSDSDFESPKRKKKLKKQKKNKLGRNSNIQVKIRFKQEQVKLKITQSQKRPKKAGKKMLLTQYILNVCENTSPNNLIAKPDHGLTPHKKKYIKLEKSPDNLVQTSIQNFFRKVPSCDSPKKE